MLGHFNSQCDAEWAIAQVDYRDQKVVFGTHNENQAFALRRYRNGGREVPDRRQPITSSAVVGLQQA